MNRKLSLFLLLTFAAAAAFAETTRYVVVTKQPARGMRLAALADASNIDRWTERRVREFSYINGFAADLTDYEAAELRRSPNVLVVEEVVERKLQAHNFKPGRAQAWPSNEVLPWGVRAIRADQLWAATKGSKQVNVAVLDTGVDITHPDLKDSYAGGANLFYEDKPPQDDYGHGSHVSGTIAAAHNGTGVYGIAPNVKMWAVKILDNTGWGTSEHVVRGLDWVLAKKKEVGGAWVVNLSVGAPRPAESERLAVLRAQDEGIILVAAAGNESFYQLIYPAGYANVIAVGAVDNRHETADFSNYGVGLSVMAPGVEVESTFPVGLIWNTKLQAEPDNVTAYRVAGSPFATVTDNFIDCGYGRPLDFPVQAAGKIALVKRGPRGSQALSFFEKVVNARRSGATAVVIYNDDDVERKDFNNFTLGDQTDPPTPLLLTVSISNEDGLKLLDNRDQPITISHESESYGLMSGTSMATPHVTGAIALLLSLVPNATFAQIHYALEHTTIDVDAPGWDFRSAWGMVNTLAAAHQLAPEKFGLPQPGPTTTKRRSVKP